MRETDHAVNNTGYALRRKNAGRVGKKVTAAFNWKEIGHAERYV